jgi:hypothetical protein
MKKRSFLFTTIITFIIALVFVVTPALAGVIRTSVTATETPVDSLPGEMTYPGGNVHIRNMTVLYQVASSDDRLTGVNTVVTNANLDASANGPAWGTFHNDVAAYDGYWQGTWSGTLVAGGAGGYSISIVGLGYGDLEGLMITATEVNGQLEGILTQLPTQ